MSQATLGFSRVTCTHTHQNPYLRPWAQVKGLQKPTGTPTCVRLCLQRWPMNLTRAVQVSMDTAMQTLQGSESHLLVFWGFRWFHGCFHGLLGIIRGLCLRGGGGFDIGVVIVFAMVWGGLVLITFVARFAWLGQHSQHGMRRKGH